MSVEVIGTPLVGVEQLAAELGLDLGDEADGPKIKRSWAAAVAELNFQLKDAFRPIEAGVLDSLRLEVAAEEFARLDRPSSGSQYVDMDGGQPVRGPRDPLNRVYPILDRYRVAL
ncbi:MULTISPECIES: hypothetical protein [unclassified Aeromicrobium]|uniref:hypothetical protein n=1 Tax=unclassified Aeromicrobium TaxID=2633570 RepID=UPI00288A9D67|nr:MULTISPECIES: hypothetical protein [unclassified Aeromicrobium]